VIAANVTAFSQQNQSVSAGGSFVSVVRIRPTPKPGGVTLGYADVSIGPVTIFGISIVRNKAGGEFVAFPSRSGKGRWFPGVEIDEPFRTEVIDLVLEFWRGRNS
jgi:hypothetical protein